MSDMSERDDKRHSGTGYVVAVVVVLLLVPPLYFASLGPLAWLLGPNIEPGSITFNLWMMYAYPGELLYEAGYGEWLSDYVEWWVL